MFSPGKISDHLCLLYLSSRRSLYTYFGGTYGRYGANIIFNIANKKSLTAFPCPWFISTLQLGN